MSLGVKFYESSRGDSPVEKFLNELDTPVRAKVVRSIETLSKFGPRIGMPLVRFLRNGIFELRIRGRIDVRVTFSIHNETIFLLHAFKKKSDKTPPKEIELSESRDKDID